MGCGVVERHLEMAQPTKKEEEHNILTHKRSTHVSSIKVKGSDQCDQRDCLSIQFLAIYNVENYPILK